MFHIRLSWKMPSHSKTIFKSYKCSFYYNYFPLTEDVFLHFKNFNYHYPRMCNANVSWNLHSSAKKEEDFFKVISALSFFPLSVPLGKGHSKAVGWNWPCGSGDNFLYISSVFSHIYHKYYPLQNGVVHSKTLHPKMICVKLDWNWPNGSGEEIQTGGHINGHQDRRTDKWQTTGDEKSSLKFSAQVS